jgi:hypothetical protein
MSYGDAAAEAAARVAMGNAGHLETVVTVVR